MEKLRPGAGRATVDVAIRRVQKASWRSAWAGQDSTIRLNGSQLYSSAGVYPGLVAHAQRRLYDRGLIITVNSDDPTLFGTTLNDELALLASAFDPDVLAIDEILLNAVRHSFVPEPARRQREVSYGAKLDTPNPTFCSRKQS